MKKYIVLLLTLSVLYGCIPPPVVYVVVAAAAVPSGVGLIVGAFVVVYVLGMIEDAARIKAKSQKDSIKDEYIVDIEARLQSAWEYCLTSYGDRCRKFEKSKGDVMIWVSGDDTESGKSLRWELGVGDERNTYIYSEAFAGEEKMPLAGVQ